jgi:hypothetical protein
MFISGAMGLTLVQPESRDQPMTMHDFEAKHWVIAVVIILLAVGAFAYSWS